MSSKSIVDHLRNKSKNLKTPEDLGTLIESIKDRKIVMLGEASHGTSEFYRWRTEISKQLIRNHGFEFIAVEGDWPDSERITRYILEDQGASAHKVLSQNRRWPTWMWANEETAELVEWLKVYETPFYGLDVYSFFESIEAASRFLSQNHPEHRESLSHLKECLSSFSGDGVRYAKSLIYYPEGCIEGITQMLNQLHQLRLKDRKNDQVFAAFQNAVVAQNAEEYYRTMLHGDEQSWNIRDRHMMSTLQRLLERHQKGIVWAHNTHIGDYRATDMAQYGMVSLGGLAREELRPEHVALVGFGSYEGQVVASYAWEGDELILPLPPALSDSYEDLFHTVSREKATNNLFVLMDSQRRENPLAESKGHRAVGVVYNPRHESHSQYVRTELAVRYDAFVFIDRSSALRSFKAQPDRRQVPETYPVGQ